MDAVEEVKARLSIEDVIGEYVTLKRAGRNWKGLSPFTNEKTPSFTVSPEKQIWHDFSSNKGGDIFSFVMEVEGLDFRATLELLARKAGMDLEQFQSKGNRQGPTKERLYAVLEAATKFYQVQFSHSQLALEYVLKTRGFTKETALTWKLGYAPNTGRALVTYLQQKSFTAEEIIQAGLSSKRFRSPNDMFRGRLMIPLQDAQGRVIGFTARLLESDASGPKYINTPQTALYDKSRHIFGLHHAKEAIRRQGYGVLVEGNLDVIASHEVGVKEVVATAGTALTEPHLKALSRLTEDIRICFDADRAGMAATERAIPIASRVNVSLSVILLSSGKDPDELIKKDADLWRQAVTQPMYALDWLMDRYSQQLDIRSADGKRRYSGVLLPVVRALSDDVERDHYLNAIAARIGVSTDALRAKLSKTENADPLLRSKEIKQRTPLPDSMTLDYHKVQDHFLALMLLRPTLREFLELMSGAMFPTDAGKAVFSVLQTNPDFSLQEKMPPQLQNLSDYVKIETVLYEELYHGLELNELHYEAARLQSRLVEIYVKTKKAELAQAMSSAEEVSMDDLLQQAKKLDQLLKLVKGTIAHAES